MARWKLFGRSKPKEEEISKPEEKIDEEEITEPEEPMEEENILEDIETEQELKDQPLAEYHETLYTGKSKSKRGNSKKQKKMEYDQRIWRDVEGIEDKIDKLHITRAKKPITELDKKVDRIISNIEIEKHEGHRKSSNVIYVVSKPQPGEVRGDWAVRSHGKIYSHHKTKEKAIKVARKIAKEKNATVLVQNTDGTFSEGFKPRE